MSVNLSSAGRTSARLGPRRQRNRRRAYVALGVILVLLTAGIIYELNQPAVRVSSIIVYGADQSFADVALKAMQGRYLGLIPRDSIFFFPASSIRADIISLHPDIAAVSLFRNGFTGLTIKVNDRVPIARWCGLAPSEGVDEYCYIFDASGFIFAALATSTQTVNSFALYAPLVGETLEAFRATIAGAEKLPAVFDLARKLGTHGSPVARVVFRKDEVDDHLVSGTRVTYVLGNEENAYTALLSAGGGFNLKDGSVDYIDLRFDGKVYVKKRVAP